MYYIIMLSNTRWNSYIRRWNYYIRLLVFTDTFKADLVQPVSLSFTQLQLIQKKTISKVIPENKTDV